MDLFKWKYSDYVSGIKVSNQCLQSSEIHESDRSSVIVRQCQLVICYIVSMYKVSDIHASDRSSVLTSSVFTSSVIDRQCSHHQCLHRQ